MANSASGSDKRHVHPKRAELADVNLTNPLLLQDKAHLMVAS